MLHRLVGEHGIPAGKGRDGPLPLKYAVGGLIGFEFLQQFFFLEQRRAGGIWQAGEDNATLAGLRPAYRDIGLLDERLSLYDERYRHEPGPGQFNLEAIAARWQYEEARTRLNDQEEAVEAAFRDAIGK